MSFEVMSRDPETRVKVAIEDIRAGKMVILIDDEDRENEGDLTLASDRVTPEAINFMATHGRGLICVTLTEERVEKLNLPMMASNNRSPFSTAFTVSVEARDGVTTGISAADRARTVQVLIDPTTGPNDIVTPGHMFPLKARNGGVLVRTGQTEGSVDLARLAGLNPSGVICEIMNDDGTMSRLPDLERFGANHGIHIVAVADLVRWRLTYEQLVTPVLDLPIVTEEFGAFQARVYQAMGGGLHLALWVGDLHGPVLTRVQASSGPVDVLRALASGSTGPLRGAMSAISKAGKGVLLYLHIDGTGPEATLARMRGEASSRDPLHELGLGAQILAHLGVREIRLLTNNPRKIVGLDAFGLHIVEHVALG
jgi:3,4-dihydroxy 2-butanone 4-phosphate synthase/GTP cyclohydrolase II